jgi:hypothetical protein
VEYNAGVYSVYCVQIIKLGRVETPYIHTINQAGPSGSRATTPLFLTEISADQFGQGIF